MNPFRNDFMIDPDVVFLNHGSFGAVPRVVWEKFQGYLLEQEWESVDILFRGRDSLVREAMKPVAELLGTEVKNTAWVINATSGLNAVIRSIPWSADDEVVMSNQEYDALNYTWRFVQEKIGFSIRTVDVPIPCDDWAPVVEGFRSAITPKTRAIFFSHILATTGLILPADAICAVAKEAGVISIVDGAHCPGQIDLSLDAMGADYYAGNCHKWLCSPKGTAVLYVGPDAPVLPEPPVISWNWHPELTREDWAPAMELQGTRDMAAVRSIPHAIDYWRDHILPNREACTDLISKYLDRAESELGLTPMTHNREYYSQLGAAVLPEGCALQPALKDQYNIEIPHPWFLGRASVRMAAQIYNSEDQVDTLIAAMGELLS
jgi:isopenicillin-N epimerase